MKMTLENARVNMRLKAFGLSGKFDILNFGFVHLRPRLDTHLRHEQLWK